MAAAELTFNTSLGVPQPAGTKGINEYLEITGAPELEIFQVFSDFTGDFFFSRRFQKIKALMVQSHGATFATGGSGISKDPPKLTVTQGTKDGPNAKITITKSNANESFSIYVFGEL